MTQDKNMVCELNGDADEFDVENFFESFQAALNRTRLKTFYVEGFNLNWQGKSGHLFLTTNKAQEVLSKIQPHTDDITVEVFKPTTEDSWKLKVVIYHHDCPTGSKMYFYSTKYGITAQTPD
jgi:hypothetical protein